MDVSNLNTEEIYQWQLTKTTIGERMKHLYNNVLMADVNFLVADNVGSDQPKRKVPCHKFILAVSSPVFFTMFYGQMPETVEFIDLPDCDFEGFLEFLRYIYCDEIKLTGNCVMQVLYLAKKYMIPSLTAKCRSFLEVNLNAQNVSDVLPHLGKLEEDHLANVCWKIVDSNTEEFLQAASSSLLENEQLLSALLRRDSLNVSEIKIFQAVNCWAEEICRKRKVKISGKEKRSLVGEKNLELIRFPLMSQEEFAKCVPDSGILKAKEIVQLFMHFNLRRNPGRFSFIPRGTRNIQRCKRFSGSSCFWHYNRDFPDVISFTVNDPVLLRGVRLFGFDREKYFVKLIIDGKTVVEDQFQTENREEDGYYGFDVIFQHCVQLHPNKLYVLKALIHGPKSFYGVSGKEQVVCGKVTFQFTGDTLLNGSSVSQGQFAEVLFTCL